jgi:DNA-damage-inducible protein J
MAGNALVQTRIDPAIRDKASEVLAKSGLTVSDATRILLTRIANDGVVPKDLLTPEAEYEEWFRAKVKQALEDTQAGVSSEAIEDYFAQRRAGLKPKAPWADEE